MPRLHSLPPTPSEPIHLDVSSVCWGVTLDRSPLSGAILSELTLRGISAVGLNLHEAQTQELPFDLTGLILVMPPDTTREDLTAAFAWTQRVAPQLRSAPAGRLFSIARFDGGFGLRHGRTGEPLSAAIGGLVKTAGREWPEVMCRCLDLAADQSDAENSAQRVVDELMRPGGTETGLHATGRVEVVLEPADEPAPPAAPLCAPGEVVVVTGGARGVTAATALALARVFRPTLVILGRSELNPLESPNLRDVSDPVLLRAELIRQANGAATPRRIEAQLRQVLQQREIQANLDALRHAGAKVEYHAVDVLSAERVAAVLRDVRHRLGPIRGLVHGAGVLADRRIEDKTLEQFTAVVDTKIGGLQNLLAGLDSTDLRWVALFSSTTARLGRVGQADYAVANEGLNKLALQLAARWPHVRTAALGWGPWEGGMVTPELAKLFHQEGVGLIPLADGAQFMLEELARPVSAGVEIVVTHGSLPSAATSAATVEPKSPNHMVISVARWPILADHVLNGKATVPVALAVQWLAESGLRLHPGSTLQRITNLRILKGIALAAGETRAVEFKVVPAVPSTSGGSAAVEMASMGNGGRRQPHFAATIHTGSLEPAAEQPPSGLKSRRGSPTECYGATLFHGAGWRMLRRWVGYSETGLAAEIALAPPPATWSAAAARSAWLIDPFAVDAALQLLIVWNHERWGLPSLPSAIQEIRLLRPMPAADTAMVQVAVRDATSHRCLADAWILDRRGDTIIQLLGIEHILNAALASAFTQSRLESLVPASA